MKNIAKLTRILHLFKWNMIHSLGHVANFDCVVPVLSHLSQNSKEGNAFLLVYDLEHEHHSCQYYKLQNRLYSVQRSLILSWKQETEVSLYSGMQWIMWPFTAKLQPLVDLHVHLILFLCAFSSPMRDYFDYVRRSLGPLQGLPIALRVISIKFILVVVMLCKTECSWQLRTSSNKMYLLDILSASPDYFYSKWIGATNENFNFDLKV